jgi:putative PIN family toxin of toxin-antitoxin system
MRAVLDTNVLVSAVLSRGSPPHSILQAWHSGFFEMVTSAPLLRELGNVLSRPRISQRLGWSADERREFVAALRDGSIMVVPKHKLRVVRADPSDDRVLEASAEGRADYIVSGDQHLLDLGSYEGSEIVSAVRFLTVLSLQGE